MKRAFLQGEFKKGNKVIYMKVLQGLEDAYPRKHI